MRYLCEGEDAGEPVGGILQPSLILLMTRPLSQHNVLVVVRCVFQGLQHSAYYDAARPGGSAVGENIPTPV